MAFSLQHDQDRTARIVDGVLVLDGFVESDPLVVTSLADTDDLEGGVHTYLQLAARAARAVGASLDSGVVERAFEALKGQFEVQVSSAVERISGATTELLDEEGGRLPSFLRALEVRLAEHFDALFDEDSKSSALAVMTKVFTEVAREREQALRRAIDPSEPDSALGRMKHELLEAMGQQFRLMLGHVTDIAAAVAKNEGRAEITEISVAKGRPYEEKLAGALSRLAAHHGDSAEPVGDETGVTGRKLGDIVVRLAPQDSAGQELSMLFEAKNWSKRPSVRKVHDELDRAMTNRQAVVAIEVFPSLDASPTRAVFSPFDNKAIVVFTGDDEGAWALELAYLWARTETRRRCGGVGEEIDIAGALASLEQASRVLERIVTVKRFLGGARNHLDKAGAEIGGLQSELREALDSVRRSLEMATPR
jgi:hypothetical protein